jgi:Flavin containing amine oxidoreductase
VGGRLDSYAFNEPGGVEITVELGGMRFQQSMALVWQLVNKLGLAKLPFPISDDRLFYLRGQQIWESEIKHLNATVKLPYLLPDDPPVVIKSLIFPASAAPGVEWQPAPRAVVGSISTSR